MKNYKIFFAAILISLFNVNSFSQTIDPPNSFDIVMEILPSDNTMLVGDTTFKPNTSLISKAIVVLSDTIGIIKVNLKLGSTNGASNYINKTFVYSTQGTFTDGTSYERKGNVLYFTLGTFTGISNYFGEVRLEDAQGAQTPVLKFNNID